MDTYIPAVELIYRDLARPKPAVAQPVRLESATKADLRRDDVIAILERKRWASAEQLQQIISDARKYKLTRSEHDQLSLDLTVAIAQARQGNGRRDDPSTRFIAQVLGLLETPFGLVERSSVEDLLRAGSQNIANCKRHQPPKCQCWSGQRGILWLAQSSHGEKSPEVWAATKVYDVLEELELASRPDRSSA